MVNNVLHKLEDATEVQNKLCIFIINVADESIKNTGSFFLAVSGGSLMTAFCKGLVEHHETNTNYDFSKWVIFLADERHVQITDSLSTFGYYKEHFIDKVNIQNFIPTEVNCSVKDSSISYEAQLLKWSSQLNKLVDNYPKFDLILLGMGPDGHTCSLFPGHSLFLEDNLGKSIQYIEDSPKEPPQRVTLSMKAVNNSCRAAFMCLGKSKAELIKRIVTDKDISLPCSKVDLNCKGEIHWFMDKLASECV